MQTYIAQQYPLLLSLTAIAAVVIVALYSDYKERKESKAVLRHTIEVNLGILRNEHAELLAIANSAPSSNKVAKAKRLLASVTPICEGPDVIGRSQRRLQKRLIEVFGAMGKSTDARHLLDACHPSVE